MSSINLTYSSEMMQNYLPAELISPQEKFEAFQTDDGHSLLFSISSEGVLYLISEESGSSAAGWSKTDLSSAQIAEDFSGQSNVTCSTFEVGQSEEDGSLGIAMAISTSTGDNLYLCLDNSNTDISWSDSPTWTSYPYDNPNFEVSKLEIVNVFFCEPFGGTQYIIVDIVRDPSSTVKLVQRFYIDPKKSNGYAWVSHFLPIDVETDNYQSCIGRARKGYVDGLYTAGHVGDSGQLVFRPIINVFGEGAPPTVARLDLPNDAVPTAMASIRNEDYSTDLFVTSGSTLYYFSSSNQADRAVAESLITNDFISDTVELAAMVNNEVITLWGRNASDQVYYLTCPLSQVSESSAWSTPIPILSGIEKMSLYVNKINDSNTIFAAGDDKLKRIVQSPDTKLWQTHQITLPVLPQAESISFNSYTTTIQVSDEQDLPLKDATLSLSASNPCSVYINGLYYRIYTTPIQIQSNTLGSITIVEATNTLNGTTFTVSTDSGSGLTINPMDKPFQQLAELNTSSKLQAATIQDDNGNTQSLVSSDTSEDDLNTIATSLGKLQDSYAQLTTSTTTLTRTLSSTPTAALSSSSGDAIVVAAGDLFRWLESGVEDLVIQIEGDIESGLNFIAKIAGQAYSAVLDTVDSVVGAVQWVFHAIETAVEDLIKFVEFLFEWEDIKRTKEVLHNLIKLYLQSQIDELETIKEDFDNLIEDVETKVNEWAGITDWSGLGYAASQPASGSASNPVQGQTSASQHLSHHFQNNVNNITILSDLPSSDLLESVIDDLWTALKEEGDTLSFVLGQIEMLAKNFSNLSVQQVLIKLGGILANGVLSSTQAVADAIVNILVDVAETTLEILDTKLHIPVISDILNDIGVSDMSFLDLFCWISGVAYTVVYKVAEGEAPFPDDETTTDLIKASTLSDIQRELGGSASSIASNNELILARSDVSLTASTESENTAALDGIFVLGHSIASYCTLIATFVNSLEAAEETGENSFGIPSAVLGIMTGASVGSANYFVPKDPIQNSNVNTVSSITTFLVILFKLVYSGPLQKKFKASEDLDWFAAEDSRATGAIVNSVLTLPAFACTCWHFYELSNEDSGDDKTDAILEEVSNLASYIARISYAAAVNTEDEEAKAIEIGIMAVADVAYSGLQFAEAAVD